MSDSWASIPEWAKRIVSVLVGAAAIIAAVATVSAAIKAIWPDSGPGTLAADIQSPADGDSVPLHTDALTGTVSRSPNGLTIWALSRAVDEETFHAQKGACFIDGNDLDCRPFYLGRKKDRGRKFEFRIVATRSTEAIAALRRSGKSDGHTAVRLTKQMRTIGSIEVRRR